MMLSVDKHVHSSYSAATSSSVTSPVMSSTDAALWEKEGALNSIMFPYVRDHAETMIARIRHEDPLVHYVALQQTQDVCLYKRIPPNQDMMASITVSPVATSLSSSDISIRRAFSESAHFPGDYEFRGVTRVPGTVDTILDFFASESARENYWVALNTIRDVKAAALLSGARLQSQSLSSLSVTSETDVDATAFPRWSRKYMAMKLSRHNAQVLDCCYAEYATRCIETNSKGHSHLRGFVYRRSVSECALSSASSVSSQPLAKAHVQGAARFYIRDWLFDVVETHDPLVCKLVLTCAVRVPPTFGRSAIVSRSDFREFCTELMVGGRRALTNRLKDHVTHAGMLRSSLAWRPETRCCSVCSAQFSLLRKRYTCRLCESGACSKCCPKIAPGPVSPDFSRDSLMVSGPITQQYGSHKRECLLCVKFGPDDDLNTHRVEQTSLRGRHFSNSIASMSVSISRSFAASRGAIFDLEQEEIDQVHPDLELRSITSISSSRGQRSQHSQRSVGSIGSQYSIDELDDDEGELDKDVRDYNSRLNLRATTSKLRPESAKSSCSSRNARGLVLLSDLETLTLSGSFHRTTSVSARSSASSSARSPVNARMPAKSLAPTPADLRAQQRQERAVSADCFHSTATKPRISKREGPQESSASTEEDEDVYSEDDLANFTLKLLSTRQ